MESNGSAASVLVVGAGFAGVACAKELGEHGIPVTLVDRNNYTQFQPLLYQVATAQVALAGVVRPLRDIFRKRREVDVKMADVVAIDPVAKTVTGADGTTFTGDYLVVATGSRPNFFSTPGADVHAFPLYALADAQRLRSRVFEIFEDADRNPKLVDRGALNIVIVGAGATGVESAGALADLITRVMPQRFHDFGLSSAKVHLVDPGKDVLGPFSERTHVYARRALERKGVCLHLGVSVTEVQGDRVVLSDGKEILTRTVVWAGGILANNPASGTGVPEGHGGRIDVAADLTVEGFPGVYALGDVANTSGPDGKPFPQLGSVALQAGVWAARNICADIEGRPRTPFHYRDKGIMAMIGRNAAVAEVGSGRRELQGFPAFLAWLGVHAVLLSGFRQRATAARSWLWDYLTKNRAMALIDRPAAGRIDWNEEN